MLEGTRLNHKNLIKIYGEMAIVKKNKLGNNVYTNKWIFML